MSSANLTHPAESDGFEELAAIANDPSMRRHARRLAGDLADDVLQETWYLVARACQRRLIVNLPGYFYRALVNTSRHMRQELTRGATPVDDPEALTGTIRPGRDRGALAASSAESEALHRLGVEANRELLRRRWPELRTAIPAYSPDPDRYREAILTVAEAIVANDGIATRTEINDALTAAYPEWFAAPGVTAATRHQRHCRARKAFCQLLRAAFPPDTLMP